MIKNTNSTSEIVFSPYSNSYAQGFEDMLRRVPDLTKIKSVVNWEPKHNLTHIINDFARSIS